MAAKNTPNLLPFCHPIGLESCRIQIELDDAGDAVIDCKTKVTSKTGVEMEALTGASVAALTVYDMCKALSHGIVIENIYLVSKAGGKSDYAAA
jgi:cyclic pyranopterin phosphate synthase